MHINFNALPGCSAVELLWAGGCKINTIWHYELANYREPLRTLCLLWCRMIQYLDHISGNLVPEFGQYSYSCVSESFLTFPRFKKLRLKADFVLFISVVPKQVLWMLWTVSWSNLIKEIENALHKKLKKIKCSTNNSFKLWIIIS